jgi:hypothetical protein
MTVDESWKKFIDIKSCTCLHMTIDSGITHTLDCVKNFAIFHSSQSEAYLALWKDRDNVERMYAKEVRELRSALAAKTK